MHLAGVVSLIALAGVVGALGYLHVAPTGLSPLRNAVSQYGISKYRMGYRIATLTFAISGVALAVGVSDATHGNAGPTVVLLCVFAAARAVISWFPMDEPGTERTATGSMHGLLAIAAFGSICAAALKLSHVLVHQSRWHNLASTSKILGFVMLACLLGMAARRAAPGLVKYFGLVERAFYLGAIAWSAVFSVACITAAH